MKKSAQLVKKALALNATKLPPSTAKAVRRYLSPAEMKQANREARRLTIGVAALGLSTGITLKGLYDAVKDRRKKPGT